METSKELPAGFLQSLNDDTSSLYIVFYVGREGGSDWARRLELKHYPPGTPASRRFELLLHQWSGFPHWIVRVPLQDRAMIEQTCAECGMRLADGVPYLIRKPGDNTLYCVNVRKPPKWCTVEKTFPLRSRRTFVLERDHGPKTGEGIVTGVVFLPGGINQKGFSL